MINMTSYSRNTFLNIILEHLIKQLILIFYSLHG